MDEVRLSCNYYCDLGIFLYMIPIISSFAVAFALFANRKRTLSQKYLAVFFTVLGISMVASFVYDRYITVNHDEILRSINTVSSLACSIAVLFYFTSLMRPALLSRRFILMFCGGWFVFALLIAAQRLLPSGFDRIFNWLNVIENISSPAIILLLLNNFFIIAFDVWLAIFIFRMYHSHRKYLHENYSYTEKTTLRRIAIIIVTLVMMDWSDMLWMLHSTVIVKIWFNVLAFFSICVIFWLGFRHDEIPLPEPYKKLCEKPGNLLPELPLNVEPGNRPEEIKAALLEYFSREKPFLNPELTLSEVADALDVRQFYLSRLINKEFGMNFYTLVNNFRVDYVISLIESDKEIKSGDMLFAASGFKTRSVFYKQFKDKTGYPPHEYAERRKRR